MKKKLIYAGMFALTLFIASCSDDEKNWEKLPTTEIKGENITVNGFGNNQGTIQFSTTNGEQGIVSLNNMIYGHDKVSMNVTMTDKGDGSFDFSGETRLNSVTKSIDLAVSTLLTLNGNISQDGTATVNISTEAKGDLVSTWNLTDTIVYDTIHSYPIESPTFLYWQAITDTLVNGEQTSNVVSALVPHILSEILNQVTFCADGNIMAKYYTELPFNGETAMDWIMGKIFSNSMRTNPQNSKWIDSPKGLVNWYVKDNNLYVMPNLEMILKQVSEDNGKTDTTDYSTMIALIKSMANASDESVQKLLEMAGSFIDMDLSFLKPAQVRTIASWLNTGIPLKVRDFNNTLQVYLDKETLEPFIPIVFSLLPGLQAELDKMAEENEYIKLLPFLLGVPDLTYYQKVWEGNTEYFELGLAFQK